MRKAFTMAEVLITLGIIGVVAALTMPVILSKVEDKVLESQSLKTQNILANGMRLLMAKETVNELKYTSLSACEDKECVKDIMHKTFSIIAEVADDSKIVPQIYKFDDGEEKSIWLDNEDIIYSFVTNDGAIYGVKTFDKGTSSLNIIADINGAKNPNRGAKDLCLYYVSNGGTGKESCAQMAKVETAETDACVVPDDSWDNCQPGFKWLEIKYKHVCAKCKSGYKMVKLPGKLVAGYCMPQGCK